MAEEETGKFKQVKLSKARHGLGMDLVASRSLSEREMNWNTCFLCVFVLPLSLANDFLPGEVIKRSVSCSQRAASKNKRLRARHRQLFNANVLLVMGRGFDVWTDGSGDLTSACSSVFQWGRGSTTIDFPLVIMFDMIRSNLSLSPQVV